MMVRMDNVVSIVPDPDAARAAEAVSTLAFRAAQAAIGAVAIAMGTAAEVVRQAAGLPEGEAGPDKDRTSLLAGAALGFVTESARTAAAFADAAARAARPVAVAGSAVAAPLARIAEDLLARWDDSWERERPDAEALAGSVAAEATRRGVDAVLDQLDLTAIVVRNASTWTASWRRLDIDAVARRIDVDAIVARMDMEALIARIDANTIADRIDVDRLLDRLDLSALSLEVIDRIDLPEIIRASTGSVASESIRGVRIESRRPTTRSRGFVDRVLGRRPSRGRRMSDVQVVPAEARRLPGEPRRRRQPRPRQRDRPGHRRAPDRGPLRGLGRVRVPAPRPLVHVPDGVAHRGDHGAARRPRGDLHVAWTTSGRTYGDRVLGLRVQRHDGRPVRPLRSLLRALLCVTFPLLLAWAAVSRDRRSVQDLLVGTAVLYDWEPAGRVGVRRCGGDGCRCCNGRRGRTPRASARTGRRPRRPAMTARSPR